VKVGRLLHEFGEKVALFGQIRTNCTNFTPDLSHTVMVAHANGSSGYIPDDAAFEQVSYEITTSRLSPGCAENAIVNGFLKLMEQR